MPNDPEDWPQPGESSEAYEDRMDVANWPLPPRPRQTNCQNEPPYLGHDTVLFLLYAPDITAHSANHPDCEIEIVHNVTECGAWK